jgi:hypothetical protein
MKIAMITSSETDPKSARIISGNIVTPPKKKYASDALSNCVRINKIPSNGHSAMTASDAKQSARVRHGPAVFGASSC